VRHYYWVRGVPTAGYTDGRSFDHPGIFEVVGTKTYTTALGGTKTVFVLELTPITRDMIKLKPLEDPKVSRKRPPRR
ncbi:unnamed protein product, partial [marine sediment metagenome]